LTGNLKISKDGQSRPLSCMQCGKLLEWPQTLLLRQMWRHIEVLNVTNSLQFLDEESTWATTAAESLFAFFTGGNGATDASTYMTWHRSITP
jgi:hypothetical protein